MEEIVEKKESEIQVIANNINKGLEAFETRKAELIQLKEDAAGLTIESINDTEAIKQVSTWRKKLKAARVEIEKEGKSMRDPLTKIGKSILEKQYELIDIISPTENDLQAKEDWVKAENLKIEQEEQHKEEARIQNRIDRLAQYGYTIDITLLKGIDDEKFEETVDSARVEWQKEQDSIVEKELAAQKEREQAEKDRLELKALRERQEEADRILKERQDELDRQAKELKDQQEQAEKSAEIKRRSTQLTALSMSQTWEHKQFEGYGEFVDFSTISDSSAEEWDEIISNIAPRVELVKKEQEDRAEEARLRDIEEATRKAIAEEKERQRKADEKKAEDARQSELLRQNELEKAGDKAKWADFIAKMSEIQVPAMRSNQYRKLAAVARERIEEIQKLKP